MGVSSDGKKKPNRVEHLPSHNFVVMVGETRMGFAKVSSIEIGIETDVLQEGGENGFVHYLTKPASTEKILLLERGAEVGGGKDSKSDASVSLRVGARFSSLTIMVLDLNRKPQKAYSVSEAIVKKRRLSDLNALSGEVFIESLEIAYRELTEVSEIKEEKKSPLDTVKGLLTPKKEKPKPEPFTKPLDPAPKKKPSSGPTAR